MYLVDTMVLSELRNPHVVGWLQSVSEVDLFLSVITIAEIERGIARQRTSNPSFATELNAWLEIMLRVYDDRILPLTTAVARRWGQLTARIAGRDMNLAIAATALEHGLIVATRNTADFADTEAATFNPFVPPR